MLWGQKYYYTVLSSVAEKRKMMEILRKAGEEGLEEEEGRGEEGDCASLEERLAGVHLGK